MIASVDRNQPTYSHHTHHFGGLALTKITAKTPAILTKTFCLSDTGSLLKTSVAHLTDGTAELVSVGDLTEFSALLDDLPARAALVYGTAEGHPTARIVSEDRRAKAPEAITRTRRYFGFRRGPGIMMFDCDHGELAPRELIATLRTAAPCLAAAPMLWRASASSGIRGPDGRELTGLTGQRVYIPVTDAGQIPEAGAALVCLLWASGHGRIAIGKAGQALERTLVDASVWQPERLDFAAPPVLTDGLTRTTPPAFVDGDPAALFDLRELIATADGTAQSRATAARKAAREAARPELSAARDAWVAEQAPTLAEAHGLTIQAATETLRRASDGRELTGDFVLQAADGSTPSVGELLDHPAKWHGKRFADPLEPDYSPDRRIAWANLRSGGRPYLFSHAHGGRRFELIRPSAKVRLSRGDRARVVDSLLDLIRERGELYDLGTGSALSRVSESGRVLPVGRDWLADYLDRAAQFFTLRQTAPDEPPRQVSEDAPAWAPARLIAKDGERGLPALDAVVTAPTLRRDGSILAEPGYDPASRLLLLATCPDLPHIPEAPSEIQARAALETLWAPFRLFPLVDEIDRGVVLSALLTACVRASLPTAPGIALDAPAAGTGKTLLGQAIAALSLGHPPAVLPPAGNQDDETRKRLFAALRDGHRAILWDNVREPLGNGALDAFLTGPTFGDRILGESTTAVFPNRAVFVATGNNLRLVGDTCRRILPARLDAELERPYAREFDFCPLAQVMSRRGELVQAALTIIRAHITAGRPRVGKGRSASFEDWDDLVRQPVCWVASFDERFGDPLTATERAFEHDPETAKFAALLGTWRESIGTAKTTTGALIARATVGRDAPGEHADTELWHAIHEIAGERATINARMLGRFIERHVDRRLGGLRIARGKLSRGSQTWILVDDRPAAAEHLRVVV